VKLMQALWTSSLQSTWNHNHKTHFEYPQLTIRMKLTPGSKYVNIWRHVLKNTVPIYFVVTLNNCHGLNT